MQLLRTAIQRVKKRSEGSVLLIALILLAAIALSTIYLSLVLLNEIKSTRFADTSIVSHYVAETASERSLWRLKYAKEQNNVALFTGLMTNPSNQCAAEDGGTEGRCTGRCSNDLTKVCTVDGDCISPGVCNPSLGDPERLYSYTAVDTAAPDFTAYDIPRNSPVFADIYDPNFEGVSGFTGVTQLNIDWYTSLCTGTEGSANLETTYTQVQSNDLAVGNPATQINVCGCSSCDPTTGLCKCNLSAPTGHSAQIAGLSSGNFYRISFRSLDVPVKKLVLTADAPLPSQVQVKATGTYRDSQTQVTLRTLWKDTLSGIFNYVVFSEESLIKDTKGQTSAPYQSLCGFCSDSNPGSPPFTACSSDVDCGSNTCTFANTAGDTLDQATTQAFCSETQPGYCTNSTGTSCSSNVDCNIGGTAGICTKETYVDGTAILQTNTGACNASCNGKTFCGDGFRQDGPNLKSGPNGVGTGGPSPSIGNEQCDDGTANNDTLPDECRTTCVNPKCGDGVKDNLKWELAYVEECDDANAFNTDLCDTNGTAPNTHGACRFTYCGDQVIQATDGLGVNEVCDNGANNGAACPQTCSSSCTTHSCP